MFNLRCPHALKMSLQMHLLVVEMLDMGWKLGKYSGTKLGVLRHTKFNSHQTI